MGLLLSPFIEHPYTFFKMQSHAKCGKKRKGDERSGKEMKEEERR